MIDVPTQKAEAGSTKWSPVYRNNDIQPDTCG